MTAQEVHPIVPVTVGMQPGLGFSTESIYEFAQGMVARWELPRTAAVVDVGGGAGNFTRRLLKDFDAVEVLDCEVRKIDPRVTYRATDLNQAWPLADNSMDGVVSLEVIEHVENPRHFFREAMRVLRPGGRGLITTPNQLSLASKLCLLLKDEFQHFQDSCYPGHITALVAKDLIRIARESQAAAPEIFYLNPGRIPLTHRLWPRFLITWRRKTFSDNMAIAFRKSAA